MATRWPNSPVVLHDACVWNFTAVGVVVVVVKCSRRATGYFTLIGDKAPPAARDSSEAARAPNQRYYPDTEYGGHS